MIQVPSTLERPTVIAEVGCNHRGEVETARDIICAAKAAGADVVKFQKRNPKECLSPDDYAAPHPAPWQSYGSTYGEHRERLEFGIEVHKELKLFAEGLGIKWSSSVWDVTSAREVIGLEPDFIKIPSAHNQDSRLLSALCEEFSGDIHVSCGMADYQEIEELVLAVASKGRSSSLVLYACTSGYPIENADACVLEVERLRRLYVETGRAKAVGYSGHHKGASNVDVPAYIAGATFFERHFTLDRTWKGTDHAASLEPHGLAVLCRDLRVAALAWRRKDPEVLPVEQIQRAKLKKHRSFSFS